MTFEIKGLGVLVKTMDETQEALELLGQDFATIEYNAHDAASVEAALRAADQAISERLDRFRGNAFVDQIATGMRREFENMILEHVANARISQGGTTNMHDQNGAISILRQIENAVLDLRGADYQTFDNGIEKLSHLVNDPALSQINAELQENIDLAAWLEEGEATQGGMVGSAKLRWPREPQRELGMKVALIHYLAEQDDRGFQFAHSFYHVRGGDITTLLRNMVGQVLVPFARDYQAYVRRKIGTEAEPMVPTSSPNYGQQIIIQGSTVTNLQTGAHAQATILVGKTDAGTTELLRALDLVSDALSKVPALPRHDKDEILELVSDSKAELAKERPNGSRLASFLGMIAAAVGTVADFAPACDALKKAAAGFGLNLG